MIDVFIEWLTFMPNLAAMLIIGVAGEVAKKLILGPKYKWPMETIQTKKGPKEIVAFTGFKGVYAVTYKVHAIFVGVAVAVIGSAFGGLPVPEHFAGDGWGGAMLNYGGCGAAAMVAHAALIGQGKTFTDLIRVRLGMNGKAKDD